MTSGYYRFPTIHNEAVVFICEDDLWTVSSNGGIARRLTANLGEAGYPLLSPNGKTLAFTANDEGQAEIYCMSAGGGPAHRMTFLGGSSIRPAGWNREGKLVFASNANHPFRRVTQLYCLDLDTGGTPEALPFGPASAIAFSPTSGILIGRNTADPARWKRYRGGTAGQFWIDLKENGKFKPFLHLKSNLAVPMWIGERIYFISDHEGIGNLYSCTPDGKVIKRHTDHSDYYTRNASTDGKRIVYHSGADLYLFDPQSEKSNKIEIEYLSPQTQRNRKFIHPAQYLESLAPHPHGHSLAVTSRGKIFTFSNWEGAVNTHGQDGVRYRLPAWLNDGKRLVAITDQDGEENFTILQADGSKAVSILTVDDTGRPREINVNPKKDMIAFSNHRHELCVLDLETHELKKIDRGIRGSIRGFDWSPDGCWLAYSVSVSMQTSIIKLWKADTGETFPVTRPVLHDIAPSFDPNGKFLYFLSLRNFEPVMDALQFDIGFPNGMKPYLITLQQETTSPFIPVPKPDEDKKEEANSEETKAEAKEGEEKPVAEHDKKEEDKEKPVCIDLTGIEHRIIEFPVESGRYGRICGIREGKVIYSRYPLETMTDDSDDDNGKPHGSLWMYSFDEQKEEMLTNGLTDFEVSRDASTMVYLSGRRLRVLKTGSKPDREAGDAPGRKSGWIDLGRVRVQVIPALEWKQMYREAWRLQRDNFWTEDMSRVDWLRIYDRYLPLVERIGTRAEFSDLMWEMQGELGTSHAYEFGGDYRTHPHYSLGLLGADFSFDPIADEWVISHIVQGDAWDTKSDSPLNAPGINVAIGDRLVAINGIRLNRTTPPNAALVNLAGSEVTLTFSKKDDQNEREITVKTLGSETPARYREWVETNRKRVHDATLGRAGYIHIPDMGGEGYAEFHRGFLAEIDREGLIVDVRFNSGGFVSSILLEKLARKRIGYDISRWDRLPEPFPPESVMGPMLALTNEQAGSDGDIFSHSFKLMKLGPLLGKRTWGGVIGISPTQFLVDKTVTTQPEYSFWFEDVGWGVENYGTDPDIEVENLPQDYARGVDVQLERSIEEINKMLDANPPHLPDFKRRPAKPLPKLPGR